MTSSLSNLRLAELQFTTQAYINDEPTTITLTPTRSVWTTTASGARDFGPDTPRAPQVFRIVREPNPDGIVYSKTDGGRTYQYAYTLVGLFNSIVEIGDTWNETATDGSSIHYHVDSVDPFNGWEVRANVLAYATEPQHGG